MTCQPFQLPDGTRGIACVRTTARRCAICKRPGKATRQCDYPIGKGKTCDAYLCAACAVPVGPDRDYCCTHPQPKQPLLIA